MTTSSESRAVPVTPLLLRDWGMPTGGASKHDRGAITVIGGAPASPGAAMLAGAAALRVGAGRLTLVVDERVATAVAVAVPEAGVLALGGGDDPLHPVADGLAGADAVVVGPGLDDVDGAALLLRGLSGRLAESCTVAVDAFALGALANDPGLRDALPEAVILTPNPTEAGLLLGSTEDGADAGPDDIVRLAELYRAVVSCQGTVAAPDGSRWTLGTGGTGLGTSGSGDVLAGAIGGTAARGLAPERAAVWGTHLHAAAGDRLSVRIGPTGYLARELVDELPRVLVEVHAGTPAA